MILTFYIYIKVCRKLLSIITVFHSGKYPNYLSCTYTYVKCIYKVKVLKSMANFKSSQYPRTARMRISGK